MLERLDCVQGVVNGRSRSGCYVTIAVDPDTDASGEMLGFYYGGGRVGDVVLLSVRRYEPGRDSVLCALDSVIAYADDAEISSASISQSAA